MTTMDGLYVHTRDIGTSRYGITNYRIGLSAATGISALVSPLLAASDRPIAVNRPML